MWREWPRGTALIVVGDLNVNLESTGVRGRDEDIVALVATAGLEDILKHLFTGQSPWCRDRRMWTMVQLCR